MDNWTWVTPKQVNINRLTPEYYAAEYLALDAVLEEAGKSIKLVELGTLGKLFSGPFGSELPTSLFVDEGIPLLRVQNVEELSIGEDNLAHISVEIHCKLHKSRLMSGDLAIAKAGRIGTTAITPASMQECNITEHIVGMRVDRQLVDNYFLGAFLTSNYGKKQLRRQGVGTLLKYLGVDETRQARVPLPPRPIQEYIGAKVRLAEQCRARAGLLRLDITRRLNLVVGIDLARFGGTVGSWGFKVLNSELGIVSLNPLLLTTRLDPSAYNPARLSLLEVLKEAKCPFQPIDQVAENVSRSRKRGTKAALGVSFFISILHVNDAGVVDLFQAKNHSPVSPGMSCERGDVLLSAINPSQNRVAVWSEDAAALCSSEFAIYRASDGLPPHYLASVLRSAYCLAQLEVLTRGTSSSRRRLSEEDLTEIQVPVVAIEEQKRIAKSESEAVRLDTVANALTAETKADIDALVEGRLDTGSILSGRKRAPLWEETAK